MNNQKLIEELKKTNEGLQAKVEEQERAIQFLMDCPLDPVEFARRSEIVNRLLDEKPSETLERITKERY